MVTINIVDKTEVIVKTTMPVTIAALLMGYSSMSMTGKLLENINMPKLIPQM